MNLIFASPPPLWGKWGGGETNGGDLPLGGFPWGEGQFTPSCFNQTILPLELNICPPSPFRGQVGWGGNQGGGTSPWGVSPGERVKLPQGVNLPIKLFQPNHTSP